MLYIYSSNVQTGKFAEFEKWVVSNHEQFARAQPKSWNLKGIYFTAFGLGENHVEIHWEIDGYGALEIARATAKEEGPWYKFLTELHSHLDPATGRARLLKNVSAREALIVGC